MGFAKNSGQIKVAHFMTSCFYQFCHFLSLFVTFCHFLSFLQVFLINAIFLREKSILKRTHFWSKSGPIFGTPFLQKRPFLTYVCDKKWSKRGPRNGPKSGHFQLPSRARARARARRQN